MRLNSMRQLAYWAHPKRWPEAARRVIHARRATAWCRNHAVTRTPSRTLAGSHPDLVAQASARVDATKPRLGGAGNLDLLYDLCEQVQAVKVIETGVAHGWSSLAILASIAPRDGHLWSTDLPYPYLPDAQAAVGVAVPDELRSHWTLLSGTDRQHLEAAVAQAGMIDLAHYDSDKSYAGASWAYRVLFAALRPGGVLIADDIGDHLAFRDFAAEMGVAAEVIAHDGKFQGIVRRPDL